MDDQHNLFEGGHSWEMGVSASEMARVHILTRAMSGRKDGRNVVWVVNIGGGVRRWFTEGYMCRAYVDATGADSDPVKPVTIPTEFLPVIEGMLAEHAEATLYLNEDQNVITCRAGDEYAVIDAWEDPDLGATYMPLFPRQADTARDGVANVKSSGLESLARAYHASWWALKDQIDGLAAFTTFSLARAGGTMHWTIDWTRWGRSALSGVTPAGLTTDDFSVTFYGMTLMHLVENLPLDEETTVIVDDCLVGAPRFVTFRGSDWGMVIPVLSEGLLRVGGLVTAGFKEFGFVELNPEAEEQFDDFIKEHIEDPSDIPAVIDNVEIYVNDDVTVYAEVMPGTAGPDCVRLSFFVASDVPFTTRLAEELGTLNRELVNARLVHAPGDCVKIIVDVDNPRGPEHMRDGILNMLAAIGACDGFEQFLPLFAETGPELPDD